MSECTTFAAANHQDDCVARLAFAATPGATGRPVIAAIIAEVEALYAKFGPSIVAALPALLASAGVPTWLIPVIETIVANLPVAAAA